MDEWQNLGTPYEHDSPLNIMIYNLLKMVAYQVDMKSKLASHSSSWSYSEFDSHSLEVPIEKIQLAATSGEMIFR